MDVKCITSSLKVSARLKFNMNRPVIAPDKKLFKRKPYFDYQKVADKIPEVLQKLYHTKRGDIAEISKTYGIPFSTLSRWHKGL